MKLQQIIDAIAERYPHSLSTTNVIDKINIVIAQMYSTLYRPMGTLVFDLDAGNPFYPLADMSDPLNPVAFSPDAVMAVVVEGKEYEYKDAPFGDTQPYYYVADGYIVGIVPTPAKDIPKGLTIFHNKAPQEMTTADLGSSPDFPDAYHMLIVYRVCADLAAIANDGGMVDVFAASYNALETEYKRSRRAKPQQIKDVYGGCAWT